jgi:hypothetical protein
MHPYATSTPPAHFHKALASTHRLKYSGRVFSRYTMIGVSKNPVGSGPSSSSSSGRHWARPCKPMCALVVTVWRMVAAAVDTAPVPQVGTGGHSSTGQTASIRQPHSTQRKVAENSYCAWRATLRTSVVAWVVTSPQKRRDHLLLRISRMPLLIPAARTDKDAEWEIWMRHPAASVPKQFLLCTAQQHGACTSFLTQPTLHHVASFQPFVIAPTNQVAPCVGVQRQRSGQVDHGGVNIQPPQPCRLC